MAESPESLESLPRTHILVGNPGYPVVMLSAENDFATLTVQHWKPDVRAGDKMLIGADLDTCWTYIVTANTKADDRTWKARLMRHSRVQGIKGAIV